MSGIDRAAALAALTALLVPAVAHAQNVCTAPEVEVTSIGVGGISCGNCTLIQPDDPRESRWAFGAEPVVLAVEPDGPAAGLLRQGDVIVAIDGHLITTQEGGRLFRQPPADQAVSLRVRRGSREVTVAVEPAIECEAPRRQATAVGTRNRGTGIDSVHVSPGETTVYPSAGQRLLPRLLPRGWMGMSFVCSDCEVRLLADSTRVWSFTEPPSIMAVERNGPAGRSGLRNGDRIISIDGIDLLSRAGGERLGAVSPGQTVMLGVERGGRELNVRLQAGERRMGIGSGGSTVGSGSIATSSGGTSVGIAGSSSIETGVVRYSGRIGDTMIEVRGEPVTVIQSEGETIIRSSTITVRLRRAEGGR